MADAPFPHVGSCFVILAPDTAGYLLAVQQMYSFVSSLLTLAQNSACKEYGVSSRTLARQRKEETENNSVAAESHTKAASKKGKRHIRRLIFVPARSRVLSAKHRLSTLVGHMFQIPIEVS